MPRAAIKRKEKKILREVSILGLPGSHYWRVLALFEKFFSISIIEPSGLFPELSIHCFTIVDSAEGCAYGSAKNQFSQYKHPFCRKLKQKKNAVHWRVAKQQKGHMSRTIYIFCITTLPFLTPSSHKLLWFFCARNMERNYIEANFSSFLLYFHF